MAARRHATLRGCLSCHLPLRIAAHVAFMRLTCCAVNCVRQASSVYSICAQEKQTL